MSARMGREAYLRRCADMSQVCGVRRVRLEGGRADGMGAYLIENGSGLELMALAGRCLDIAGLRYRGVNMSFLSKNGLTSPAFASPHEDEYLNAFPGGMLYTCGLLNAGPAGRDEQGVWHPIHGRIAATPVQDICASAAWQEDGRYAISLSGTMRESRLFGHCLYLHRRVETALGEDSVTVTDVLENAAPEPQEYKLLYHYNFGYPMLDEGVRVLLPQGTESRARDSRAQEGFSSMLRMEAPQDGYAEQVFFHRLPMDEGGFCTVRLQNERLGIGAALSYDARALPLLVQWKSMRSGDYALGLEPSNTHVSGVGEPGDVLKPFERRAFVTRLEFYTL